ncbi:uncharacterized protein LOC135687133 isoform X1 [Rhopilema esculentum]|uniref:uncharacterized protein LOC135687133 isoform X1 n=1 Tax=Rhopilema esculentum TaxID=499914 RepID=UPI0031DDA971
MMQRKKRKESRSVDGMSPTQTMCRNCYGGAMEDDSFFLETVVQYIPKHMAFGLLKSCDTNYWLRHQVPSSVAKNVDQFLVLQDGNRLYRAASLAKFKISDFLPTLRILSMKYGIEKFEQVMKQPLYTSTVNPDGCHDQLLVSSKK